MDELIPLHTLETPQDAEKMTDTIAEISTNEEGFQKEIVTQILALIENHLSDPDAQPSSKLATLHIFRWLTEKSKFKILSVLSSHSVFKFLLQQAFGIDPRKSISQKGKELFPGQKNVGNMYMRLLLQLLTFWGQRFEVSKKNQPTKYKKALNELMKSKVTLPSPKQFQYLKNVKKSEKRESDTKNENSTPNSVPPNPPEQGKVINQLRFTVNKIDGLINILEDEDSPETLEKQIRRYHGAFERDAEKYSRMGESIMAETEEAIDKYFKIMDFLREENTLFTQCIPTNDLESYIDGVMHTYQTVFPSQQTQRQSKLESNRKFAARESQVHQYAPPQNDKPRDNPYQLKQRTSEQKHLSPISQNKPLPPRRNTKLVEGILNDIQARSKSKSPLNGFTRLKQQVEEQRKQLKSQSRIHHRSQQKNMSKNKSMNRLGISNFNASQAKSKVDSIFMCPPNPNAPKGYYDGSIVPENRFLTRQVNQVSKVQGHRRFKIAHWKDNYVLFENQHFQIGFKSQLIMQEVQSFIAIIGIELYFGNKTRQTISDAKLEFKGDETTLLYSTQTSKKFDFHPDQQLKYEMAIVPKDLPFYHLKFNLTYNFDNSSHSYWITLPISITKLVKHNMVSRSLFESTWQECPTMFRTEAFPLSHHLTPRKIKEVIPHLAEFTDYSRFMQQNSQTDYVLVGSLNLLDQHEALIKINIRPDLKVVVQLAMTASMSIFAQNGFRFYLQTLQALLKQNQ